VARESGIEASGYQRVRRRHLTRSRKRAPSTTYRDDVAPPASALFPRLNPACGAYANARCWWCGTSLSQSGHSDRRSRPPRCSTDNPDVAQAHDLELTSALIAALRSIYAPKQGALPPGIIPVNGLGIEACEQATNVVIFLLHSARAAKQRRRRKRRYRLRPKTSDCFAPSVNARLDAS